MKVKIIIPAAVFLFAAGFFSPLLGGEEIVVKQDKKGRISVSNLYTNHNRVISKSRRVKFKGSASKLSTVPRKYLSKIRSLSKSYGVKESLITAVARAESSFNPFAVSRKGAVGLMQLMPDTARQYGVVNRYNWEQNLTAGVKHLKYLLKRYKNSIPLVLAAYNAGEKAVKKYKGIPPYKETRNYVKIVMRYMGLKSKSGFRFSSPKRNTIYKIVTKDGRVIITDRLPAKVDGKVSVIN